MTKPHATIVAGRVSECVTKLVCELVSVSGFAVEQHDLAALSPDFSLGMLTLARATPLILVVSSAKDEVASLQEALAGIDDSFTILLCQRQQGFLSAGQGTRILTYDTQDLSNLAINLLDVLNTAREEFLLHPFQYLPLEMRTPEARGPYQGLSLSKHVMVFPDGHGIVDFTYEVQILSDSFEGISHYVGLTDLSAPETVVPSLEHLLDRPFPERFLGQSFTYRLLYPTSEQTQMSFLEDPAESTDRKRVFRFLFQPRPTTGHIVRYGMSWSHPHMYTTKGRDDSVLKCLHDYGTVNLRFLFCNNTSKPQGIFSPDGYPVLSMRNPLEIAIGTLQSRPYPALHGVEFGWQLSGISSHTTLVVTWKHR